MTIRLAAPLQFDSTVDGEGIRTVIWTQGCTHNCKGCHNPETHDFKGGFEIEVSEILKTLDTLEFQDGITLSGGDPFMQAGPVSVIAKHAKSIGLNVWAYSGFTFDQLMVLSRTNEHIKELLQNVDVLVDGKFILEEKSYDVKFRGSKNQRIIDVPKSLESGQVVTISKYEEVEVAPKRNYVFV